MEYIPTDLINMRQTASFYCTFYGIKESLINCQTSILDDSEEYLPISHLSAPSEKFWTDGFIERPFVEYAEV